MPRDFIRVDTSITTAQFAQKLLNLINVFRDTLDLAEEIKGVMDHNTDGSNYTDIEARFGLAAGNGQTVYNLVAGALGAMKGTVQSTDGLTLIDRVG